MTILSLRSSKTRTHSYSRLEVPHQIKTPQKHTLSHSLKLSTKTYSVTHQIKTQVTLRRKVFKIVTSLKLRPPTNFKIRGKFLRSHISKTPTKGCSTSPTKGCSTSLKLQQKVAAHL